MSDAERTSSSAEEEEDDDGVDISAERKTGKGRQAAGDDSSEEEDDDEEEVSPSALCCFGLHVGSRPTSVSSGRAVDLGRASCLLSQSRVLTSLLCFALPYPVVGPADSRRLHRRGR